MRFSSLFAFGDARDKARRRVSREEIRRKHKQGGASKNTQHNFKKLMYFLNNCSNLIIINYNYVIILIIIKRM